MKDVRQEQTHSPTLFGRTLSLHALRVKLPYKIRFFSPLTPFQELLGKSFLGGAFAHPKGFLYPHDDFRGWANENTTRPSFRRWFDQFGRNQPPMSIEAVVHAEDADNRRYDSVGTLLSKPCQGVVCSAMTRSPKAFFVTFCRLGQKVSKKPFEGVFVPSKWLRSPCKHKFSPLLSGGKTPPLHIFKQQFVALFSFMKINLKL